MRRKRRQGFTLFQLLILIVFLSLLLGLLLGATFRVREAASRVRDSNNLKHLGIAMHNYHDTFGKLPAAYDTKGFSAHAHLLPYIEQEALYKKIEFTKSATDPDNAGARETLVKTFQSDKDEAEPPVKNAGPTNYFVVAGTKADVEDNDGMFLSNAMRFANITDGLSNTMMTIESFKGDATKKGDVARQHVKLKKDDLKGITQDTGVKDFKDGKNIASDRGGAWIEGRFLQTILNVNRLPNDEKPDVDCEGTGGYSGPRWTKEGVNVGFGDGSVRVIKLTIKSDVWKALGTRAGGEAINTDDL